MYLNVKMLFPDVNSPGAAYPPDQAEQLLASMTRLKKRTQLDTYSTIPANAKCLYNICKMLDQRWRRWADIVQMLYKCFVFAGMPPLRDTREEFTNIRWTILDYAWTNSIHEYFTNSSQKSSWTDCARNVREH